MGKLELLEELNVSGNRLHELPPSLPTLKGLVYLRAHSNALTDLPDFAAAPALKVPFKANHI